MKKINFYIFDVTKVSKTWQHIAGGIANAKAFEKVKEVLSQSYFKLWGLIMARLQNLILLLLLVTPALIQIANPGKFFFINFIKVKNFNFILGSLVVRAEEDEVDEDVVETDEEPAEEASTDDEDEISDKNVSPDADTTLLFTKPTQASGGSVELPAGKIVEFLVGFANKGDKDFVVDSLEASFRYPMDFTYHIQNFSAIPYQKTVKPDQEATVAYSFIPADAFAGRPIGLIVNLAYRDLEGNLFMDPVFNETVQIVEFDEGFDSEVFFMYVFLVAGTFLVLFLVYSFLPGKKFSYLAQELEKQKLIIPILPFSRF